MRNQSHFAVLRILVAISALLAIRSVFKRSMISISENYSLDICYTLPTESVGTFDYTIVPLKMRARGQSAGLVQICLSAKRSNAGHSLPTSTSQARSIRKRKAKIREKDTLETDT